MSDPNPYASPVDVKETVVQSEELPPLERLVFRWLIVCSVSAAPSFFFGLTFGADFYRVAGMVVGVLMYVAGYVYLDIRLRPKLAHKTTLRRSMKIGYGARVAISILFPVGIMIDLPCGVMATEATQALSIFRTSMMTDGAPGQTGGPPAFFANLLTTILQGGFLHAFLFGFMGIVHVIQIVTGMAANDAAVSNIAAFDDAARDDVLVDAATSDVLLDDLGDTPRIGGSN